jgi:hypothetical protein
MFGSNSSEVTKGLIKLLPHNNRGVMKYRKRNRAEHVAKMGDERYIKKRPLGR